MDNVMDDEARLTIDQKILGLQDAIRQLQSQRNMLAPISRLPNELLSKIFIFTKQHNSSVDVDGILSIPPTFSWIGISHICRHWRTIAIDCTALWNDIDTSVCPAWAEEMILRSKKANLYITSDYTKRNLSILSVTRSVFCEMYRTKSLDLAAPSDKLEHLLDVIMDTAPLLERLTLRGYGPVKPGDPPVPWDAPGFDIVSAGYSKSSLRYLTLINHYCKWDSPLFSGLTHLTLFGISKSALYTLSRFLDMLESIPGLECLMLYFSLLKADNEPAETSDHRVVHLPHLSSLTMISFTTIDCARLVKCLSLPAQCNVRLSCDSENRATIVYELKLWVALFGFLRRKMDSEPLNLLSIEKDDNQLGIIFDSCLLMHFTKMRNTQSTLLALMQLAPVYEVCSLFINAFQLSKDAQYDCAFWESLLPHFYKLRHIHIEGSSGYSLIEVLSRGFVGLFMERSQELVVGERPSISEIISKLHLPFLQEIKISRTDFSRRRSRCDAQSRALENLMDFLMLRYEYGLEIMVLDFIDCKGMSSSRIKLLKEIVVDVEIMRRGKDDGGDGSEENDSEEEEGVEGNEDEIATNTHPDIFT